VTLRPLLFVSYVDADSERPAKSRPPGEEPTGEEPTV